MEKVFVQNPEFAEHSHVSKAKKVIPGPLSIPFDGLVNKAPIHGAVTGTSTSLTLLKDKHYRLIASAPCFIRLSVGPSTAVVGDVYLPGNQAVILHTTDFDTVSFIQVNVAGFIQAVEVR